MHLFLYTLFTSLDQDLKRPPPSNQVRILRPHPLGLLKHLPPPNVDQEHRNTNVTRQELVHLEVREERPKSVEDDDEDGQEQCDRGTPRQQNIPVRHDLARNALHLHRPDHEEVRNKDGDPVQGSKDRNERHKVAKHGRRSLAGVHVAQENEQGGEDDGGDGHTALVGLVHNAWRLSVLGQGPEGARGKVDIRIGSRNGKDEQQSVNRVVELVDTSVLGRDNERGSQTAGLLDSAEQGVRVLDGHAQHEDTTEVEEDDTHERLADGARDVLAGVGGLAERDADELSAEVGKGGLDHASPDTQETAGGTGDHHFVVACRSRILGKGAGVPPESETGAHVVGTAAEGNDEAEEDEHDNDEGFDERHPEFGFAKEGDVDELFVCYLLALLLPSENGKGWETYVNSNDGHTKDRDPHRHIDIWSPILQNDSRSRQVVGQHNHVFEKVVPTRSETESRIDETCSITGEGLFVW